MRFIVAVTGISAASGGDSRIICIELSCTSSLMFNTLKRH
jgi:hypothetical protein